MKKNVIKILITSFTLTIIDQMRLLIFGSGASLQVYHSFMSGQKPPAAWLLIIYTYLSSVCSKYFTHTFHFHFFHKDPEIEKQQYY